MAKVCVVGGSGYVGLGYACALAELGHEVVGLDVAAERVAALNRGEPLIYEPGLDELLTRNLAAGRLRFTTDYGEAVPEADFVFLCVGTPSLSDGEADLRQVRAAAIAIGRHLRPGHRTIVVNKSTLPVGSAELVGGLVAEYAPVGADVAVVANPEFLREGSAVRDIFQPDRIVLGADDRQAAEAVAALYAPLDAPVLLTDCRSAELVKYAANAFLATKISFINEVARLCERLGADVEVVAAGMGLDPRIGPRFLRAGLGFGGSCFPKDIGALSRMADEAGLHPGLLRAVLEINTDIRRRFVAKAERLLGGLDGRVLAVWGLSFKEDTDDLRESPALAVIDMVLERGAAVRAHDPAAMPNAARRLPRVVMAESPEAAAKGADAVLVCTPWRQFREIDLRTVAEVMRGDLLLDGRNLYDPHQARAAGLRYEGIGRGSLERASAGVDLLGEPRVVSLDPTAGQLA
jgi:UDPglucose 6-dehydrogenase